MKKTLLISGLTAIICLTSAYTVVDAQNKRADNPVSVSEMRKQQQSAEQDIKDTKTELGINEKKVTETLNSLRKIDEDISASENEIEIVQNHLDILNDTIASLTEGIEQHEEDLIGLRDEYLKSVKKMRVARKRNSSLVFLFASKSFNEARRRMRYMREFSAWKTRRSEEIGNKVTLLHEQQQNLVQAKEDVAVALKREQSAKDKLTHQKSQQEATVVELRANSEALKSKLARRQAEARKLSGQISQLIAEQQAKDAREAEARKKAEEERKIAEERVAAERRAAEDKRIAEERAKAEAAKKTQKNQTAQKTQKPAQKQTAASSTSAASNPPAQTSGTPSKGEYADARRRRSRSEGAKPAASTQTSTSTTPQKQASASTTTTPSAQASGFAGQKGTLPRPVGGAFKIVSAFGVHPISPELPDIMDENLGIDAHVANGATACAVYDGEVIKVYDRTNTPGFRNIVVLKHGDYITVYANLETLSVKTGQYVKQGQSLGSVGSDFDDPSHGMIHFELWKNQTHLDPAAWIR